MASLTSAHILFASKFGDGEWGLKIPVEAYMKSRAPLEVSFFTWEATLGRV